MSTSQVQSWLKDSLNIKLDNKSELDSLLLRGPFRNILLSFLEQRCRSEDEVDVIRSNMYVHGLAKSEPSPNLDNNKNAELTSRLAELEHKKRVELHDAMQKNNADIDDFDRTAGEWDVPTDKKQLQKLSNIIGFLDGTASDLKVLLETQNMVVLEQEDALSRPEKLDQIQEEAIKLFHSIFFETTANPQDLEELNQKLDYLCDHIRRWDNNNKGLSQKQLVVWQKSEIKGAKDLVDKLKAKLAPKASPTFAEDLLSELYTNLCKEHIGMYFRNEHLKSNKESIENNRLAQLSALTAPGQYEGDISHLVKLIYEKQMKRQIMLHDEVASQSNSLPATSEIIHQENNGLGSEESEIRENLVSCLLCNYPNKRTKLLSTMSQTGRYSEFIAALRSPADQRSDNTAANRTTTNAETNGNFENVLQALNPNRETISTNFALRFASDS